MQALLCSVPKKIPWRLLKSEVWAGAHGKE